MEGTTTRFLLGTGREGLDEARDSQADTELPPNLYRTCTGVDDAYPGYVPSTGGVRADTKDCRCR